MDLKGVLSNPPESIRRLLVVFNGSRTSLALPPEPARDGGCRPSRVSVPRLALAQCCADLVEGVGVAQEERFEEAVVRRGGDNSLISKLNTCLPAPKNTGLPVPLPAL